MNRLDLTFASGRAARVVLVAALLSAAASGAGGAGTKMSSTADLADKRIGVVMGSVYDALATETWPEATVMHFESGNDLALAVAAGKVDAGLSDLDPLLERFRTNDDLAILGEPLLKLPIGVGFRKESAELRDEFNRFLAGIRQDGTLDDMVDRWMQRHDTEMPNVAASNPSGTLLVGTTTGALPYAAIVDGKLVGFDVELSERFAAYLGRDLKWAEMAFGGLIAAVASGKVEMIIASIFITEERQQRIDFSAPYYETPGVAYVLESSLASNATAPEAVQPRRSFVDRMRSSWNDNIVAERRYLLLVDGLQATAIISVLATLFGTALGALVCFMRMSKWASLRLPARAYIAILRGIPVVVLLMIIFYVVFASVDVDPVLIAVVAFGMNFAAYVSEMFRAGIETIPRGQSEAGTAMGFTRTQTFGFIVMPQMIQRVLPVYKGEFISLVKMTSIVGYIAVQDLTKAGDIIRSRTFDAFFPLVVVSLLYFLISWVLMQSLGYLERATDPKRRRRGGAR